MYEQIQEILRKISNEKTPGINMIWVGKDYSIADLRNDLKTLLEDSKTE